MSSEKVTNAFDNKWPKFLTSLEYIPEELKTTFKNMKVDEVVARAYQHITIEVMFSGTLFIIVTLFITWCIYQIVTIVWRWYKMIKKTQQHNNKSSPTSPSNPLNDPNNDNEVHTSGLDVSTLPDAYAQMTKAIQDSFSGYANYNQKMTAYYNNVKDSAPPDLMDPSVLLPSNDDW